MDFWGLLSGLDPAWLEQLRWAWSVTENLFSDTPSLPPEAGLTGLFIASFLAATILPGGSEILLAGFLTQQPGSAALAWGLCSIGNTLGGMTNWWLARSMPADQLTRHFKPHHLEKVQRHGALTLLGSWLPLIGDALCLAAGWLRLPLLACTFWMLIGKAARYAALVWLVS